MAYQLESVYVEDNGVYKLGELQFFCITKKKMPAQFCKQEVDLIPVSWPINWFQMLEG